MPRIGVSDWLGALVALSALIAAPLLYGSTYVTGILTVSLCYGIWAASWDFMSGLTGRENFGHALFIGAGAYTAGFLNVEFGANPWWSLPAGAAGLPACSGGLPTKTSTVGMTSTSMTAAAAIIAVG